MKAAPIALLGGWLALSASYADAQCLDEACLHASSVVTTVSSKESALLDAALTSLLGADIDLTIADDQALAASNVSLGSLLTGLNQSGVGTDAQGALNANVSLSTLLTSASATVRAQGSTAAADALDKVRTQTVSVNTGGIRLGDLIVADTRSGPLASSQLNVLDLLHGSASLFNRSNVASLRSVSLTGSDLGLGSGFSTVSLSMVVVQPAQYVCGPQGAQFYSSNIRVRARVALTGTGLNLTVPLLAAARVNLVSFDLFAEVGRGSGTLTQVNAVAGTLSLNATPGVASLYLGTISDVSMLDRTTPLDVATELTPAVIGNVALTLGVVNLSVSVSARAWAIGGSPTAKALNFAGTYPQTQTATTQSGFVASLLTTLLSNLQIQVGDLSSLGLAGNLLQTLTNNLLTAVGDALKGTSGLLNPLLTAVTGNVIDPLLSPLGIKLGEVTVRAERPYAVSAGSTCNDLAYCTENDVCGANGVCAGTARSCADSVSCTTDACDEATDQCTHALASACLINGTCVASDAKNPANDCQVCNPAASTSGWSLSALGTSCDDGAFCTSGDACSVAGLCLGLPRDCGDGLLCTVDACDELLDRCTSLITIGCVANGACVAPGADDPTNACRSCNPILSTSGYANKTFGAPCSDGLFCTQGDACDGQGSCASTARDCSDGIACTNESCDEASDRCTNAVTSGCLIAGSCVAAGTTDPTSACRVCNPAASTTGWSLKTAGASCDDGLFCTTGDTCNVVGICGGSSRICAPGGTGCSSVCDELADTCRTDILGCLIGNACLAAGTVDPTSSCRVCNPALSIVAFSPLTLGTSCSDGLFCTTGDSCNAAGVCVGTARECSDNRSCTNDVCDELNDVCGTTVGAGCLIDGACIAANTEAPGNGCKVCNPAVSVTSWSNRAGGVACNDGLFCSTGDVCDGAGVCSGVARDCNGGQNGCASSCDEQLDACQANVAGCTIDGACVAAGTLDPNNPCRECNPALAQVGYSLRGAGSSCDDGLYCTTGEQCSALGLCSGAPRACAGGSGSCASACDEVSDSCRSATTGCTIDGVCRAAGSVHPTLPCLVCDPLRSLTAYSPQTSGSSCSDGLFCTTADACNGSGACVGTAFDCSDGKTCTSDVCDEVGQRCTSTTITGCQIDGACVLSGTSDPNNPCRSCNPAISTTGWSNKPAAVTCTDGLFCTTNDQCDGQGVCVGELRSCGSTGTCSSFCDEAADACRSDVMGCSIAGVCLAAGTEDPTAPCRVCDPLRSLTSYSLKATGTACSDGLYCTTDDVCSPAGICTGSARTCSDGLECTIDQCDESADGCEHVARAACVIAGGCIPAGATATVGGCKVCDPTRSTTNWVNSGIEVACDDGQFCTAGDRCDGAGSCVGAQARCQMDSLACTNDVCDENGDRCSADVSTGCLIAGQCWSAAAPSPADSCALCRPELSRTDFSYVSSAPSCDSDRDGLRDDAEQAKDGTFLDHDSDGRPDHLDPDDDGDGLPTREEFSDPNHDGLPEDARDLDEDELPDYLDPDDDGDGRLTSIELADAEEFDEYGEDVDEDDVFNWYDQDSDGDGSSDAAENTGDGDADDNGIPDYLDPNTAPRDDDKDGIPNAGECVGALETCQDTDGDGAPDWNDPDDDGDGLLTRHELRAGARVDNDADGRFDHLDADDDDDTLPTRDEFSDVDHDGKPTDARDHDLDGKHDYLDPDDDEDGILTRREIDDHKALGREVDKDGIPPWWDTDSDGDGISDWDDGRGADLNGNGIPEYLEPLVVSAPDAGVSQDAGSVDSGVPAQRDASTQPGADAAADAAAKRVPQGGFAGSGLCTTSPGANNSASLGWLLSIMLGGLTWRRRRP